MRFYVASSIGNKDSVQEVFASLRAAGHTVATDWTLTDDIPEEERDRKRDYVRSLVKRDFEGILESDVFLLLTEPAAGRSMYVELGVAIATHEAVGRPLIFVVGPTTNQAAFYFHSSVHQARTIDEILARLPHMQVGEPSSRGHEGRLEEYKALRNEMLDILKERTWGQATYAALAAGLLALTSSAYKVPGLVLTMALAIPFVFHTMQREHSRMRLGTYLRVVVEPRIPGMYWEEYLAIWRGDFGRKEGRGWLSPKDRTKHLAGFAGLYLFISVFCLVLILGITNDPVPWAFAWFFLALLAYVYALFFRLYDRVQKEYDQLWRLGPRG